MKTNIWKFFKVNVLKGIKSKVWEKTFIYSYEKIEIFGKKRKAKRADEILIENLIFEQFLIFLGLYDFSQFIIQFFEKEGFTSQHLSIYLHIKLLCEF